MTPKDRRRWASYRQALQKMHEEVMLHRRYSHVMDLQVNNLLDQEREATKAFLFLRDRNKRPT